MNVPPGRLTNAWFWFSATCGATAFLIGFVGFGCCDLPACERGFSNLFFQTLLLFILEPESSHPAGNTAIAVARVLAPIATASAILQLAHGASQEIRNDLHVLWSRDHIVICGLSAAGRVFAAHLRQSGRRVIAVEAEPTAAHKTFCRLHRTLLVTGDARQSAVLRLANAHRATDVIAATTSDSTNVEIVVQTGKLHMSAKPSSSALTAWALLGDAALVRELRCQEHFLKGQRFEAEPLSVGHLAAQEFFSQQCLQALADMRGQDRMHVVFVGFEAIAESMLTYLLRISPYRDFDSPIVTIFGIDDAAIKRSLNARYPELCKVCKWQVKPLDAEGAKLTNAATMEDVEAKAEVTAIFVCLGDDQRNLVMALQLRAATQREARWRAPIYVHMTRRDGPTECLASGDDTNEFDSVLAPFGIIEDVLKQLGIDEVGARAGQRERDAMPRLLHESYVALRKKAEKEKFDPDKDNLQQWARLKETYRQANRRAVSHLRVKLASIGCVVGENSLVVPPGFAFAASPDKPDEREELARLEHASWNIDRQLEGLRYGPVRDEARRTHPCLVPYEDLSEDIKDYDREQIDVVQRVMNENQSKDAQTRREVLIGLLGHNSITPEQAASVRHRLNEEILPELHARYPEAHFTLITPLAPGSDLILTQAALKFFKDRGAPHRLLILRALPVDAVVNDYNAWRTGGTWNGKDIAEPGAAEGKVRKNIREELNSVIADPACEWVIDLTPAGTPPELWRDDADLRQKGYQRAAAYLIERCHELIAVCDDTRPIQPGGTRETLAWRRSEVPIRQELSSLRGTTSSRPRYNSITIIDLNGTSA